MKILYSLISILFYNRITRVAAPMTVWWHFGGFNFWTILFPLLALFLTFGFVSSCIFVIYKRLGRHFVTVSYKILLGIFWPFFWLLLFSFCPPVFETYNGCSIR